MTQQQPIVTFERDKIGVTDRDTSRAHALLTEGCHGVTQRDVTHRSVTQERDSHGVTGLGSTLERLPSEGSRPRAFCAACQVGQGRNCSCRQRSKRRELTPTEATWLVLLADVAVLIAVAALVRWAL